MNMNALATNLAIIAALCLVPAPLVPVFALAGVLWILLIKAMGAPAEKKRPPTLMSELEEAEARFAEQRREFEAWHADFERRLGAKRGANVIEFRRKA